MKKGELYRDIMRNYPTGVTVITTTHDDKPVGLTANSFTSVSIDPLMILWCIDKGSNSYDVFYETEKFAVNILADEQKDLCNIFASRKEKDRFSRVNWAYSNNNLPLLEDVFAVLECKKVNQVDAGDHLILIGEVIELDKYDKSPIMYHNRQLSPVPELSINSK